MDAPSWIVTTLLLVGVGLYAISWLMPSPKPTPDDAALLDYDWAMEGDPSAMEPLVSLPQFVQPMTSPDVRVACVACNELVTYQASYMTYDPQTNLPVGRKHFHDCAARAISGH